jgi:GxxExxY protein
MRNMAAKRFLPSCRFGGRDLERTGARDNRVDGFSTANTQSSQRKESHRKDAKCVKEEVSPRKGKSFTAKTPSARRKQTMKKTREEIEKIAEIVVDAIFKVHRALGPGLLESAYQACLAYELRSRGIEVGCEVPMPVRFGEIEVEVGYRIDMLVDQCIIVENKSVLAMPPVYEAQLLTYLKLSGHRLGFLVNWNVALIKDGIKRMVNGL